MGAVLMRARAELRARSRAAISLALLFGLVGGFALAASVGARRTDSAYERFLSTSRAPDVSTPIYPWIPIRPPEVARLEALPMVERAVRSTLYQSEGGDLPLLATSADPRFGVAIARPKLIRGRLPAPEAVGEVAVGISAARELDLGSATSSRSGATRHRRRPGSGRCAS